MPAREKWLLPHASLAAAGETCGAELFLPAASAASSITRSTVGRFAIIFHDVVTVENVKRPKPSPDGLLRILKGRDPSMALYLGDNVDDALAAQAAKDALCWGVASAE